MFSIYVQYVCTVCMYRDLQLPTIPEKPNLSQLKQTRQGEGVECNTARHRTIYTYIQEKLSFFFSYQHLPLNSTSRTHRLHCRSRHCLYSVLNRPLQ